MDAQTHGLEFVVKKSERIEQLTNVLLQILTRARKDPKRAHEVKLIQACLEQDESAFLRALVGPAVATLTPKQMRVVGEINRYQQLHGCSPTLQELADTLNVSKVTVFEHMRAIHEKGVIKRNRYQARSMMINSVN